MIRSRNWPGLACFVALWLAASIASAEDYDRSAVPGNYTVGLYADAEGSSRQIQLKEGEDTFQAWVGITGDSTRVFSGLVFRLEIDHPLEMTGPIRWHAIPGLVHWSNVLTEGVQVEFNETCQEQIGDRPVMIGRISFKAIDDFDEVAVRVAGHRQHKLSVELCDYYLWKKPFAEPRNLTVKRKRSFWAKIQRLFG